MDTSAAAAGVMVGEMIDELVARDLWNETVLIVTSDHGEMFGEHDKWAHGSSIYEEVVRVPLMMRAAELA